MPCCDEYWDELNKDQQDAATVLGYNETSWNNHGYRSYLRFSVLCFLMTSVFFLRLSFLNLEWDKYVRDHVPEILVDVEDDAIWSQWAAEHDAADMLAVRNTYNKQYERFEELAACSFLFMGLSEVYRERTFSNLMLVVSGLAGMASIFYSTMEHHAVVLSSIREYLCLIPSYYSNSKLFFAACILECILSFLSLAGHTALYMAYGDIIAASMWLYCALEEVAYVFDFGLSSQKNGNSSEQGVIVEIMYSLINASAAKMKRA